MHHAVLDAVVNHLHEMAGAVAAYVAPSFVGAGRQGLQEWADMVDDFIFAADHHAVSLFQAPDAAAGAHVDIMKPFLL